MCCGTKMCMCCICLIAVVILIGLLFGFGVFKKAFHKVKDNIHACDPNVRGSLCGTGRPFLGYVPPPSPF
ncbi:putative Transmembrane protein [Melia azedarach]|uniref:Transmembrane protein n=2 Tax=Melia azedarach TaxID=155640 RepID=A0ACC1YQX3_MELAZ|nr:putative Transmembrane protein [Melia azedarach]KAJ4725414.1 putative Transmembrane protein [Melia azedarach]